MMAAFNIKVELGTGPVDCSRTLRGRTVSLNASTRLGERSDIGANSLENAEAAPRRIRTASSQTHARALTLTHP